MLDKTLHNGSFGYIKSSYGRKLASRINILFFIYNFAKLALNRMVDFGMVVEYQLVAITRLYEQFRFQLKTENGFSN